jgi:alpha-1,3-mannosyltransferase
MKLVMVIETIKVAIVLLLDNYEERDFSAYFEQSQRIIEGERNYEAVMSKNGPLVYPAVSTYINMFMYEYVNNGGMYYRPGQVINGIAYLVCVYCMVKIAQLAFVDTPKYANIVVIHCFTFTALNILVEAAFNDAFCIMFSMISILIFQKGWNTFGVVTFSISICWKMNAVLYLPAVYLIVSKSQGIFKGTSSLILILILQVVFAYPYMTDYPLQYFHSAYDFNRSFASHNSFNWAFLPQTIMEKESFKNSLLVLHLIFLLYFLFTKWLRIKTMLKDLGVFPPKLCGELTKQDSKYVAETFFICNFIGIVFSRGLYYQYVSWYLFTIPLLIEFGMLRFFRPKMKYLILLVWTLDYFYALRAISNTYTPTIAQGIMLIIFGFLCAAACLKKKNDYYEIPMSVNNSISSK